MEKINKNYVIEYVIDLLFTEISNKTEIDYNIIKEKIFNSGQISSYLSKRKNKYIYIDTLLKSDNSLKKKLKENDIYYYNNKFIIGKIKSSESVGVNFKDVDFSKYYYPYELLITKFKIPKKIKYTKTNERVLNHRLNNNLYLKKFINDLDNDVAKINIELSEKGLILYSDNSILISMTLHTYSYYKSEKFKEYLKVIKDIYPFSYFNYNNIILLVYILIKLNRLEEAKYSVILLFDNIIKNLIIKYFTNCKLVNGRIFDTFFVEEINTKKLNDYKLINEYFSIGMRQFEFISFSIGLYKLIIYLKNKYNRELKNIALELYNKNRIINDVINIDDSTTQINCNIKKIYH